jgi:hypothetical protein
LFWNWCKICTNSKIKGNVAGNGGMKMRRQRGKCLGLGGGGESFLGIMFCFDKNEGSLIYRFPV